ncbi:MAG: NUDIX hydrolase [Jatrophihabitantaceae bacterium]
MPGSSAGAAAGGVVWRMHDGTLEIALIHRPRYDDWSLAKGKLEAGESELACAVREVGEELGSAVAVQRRIGRVRYNVAGLQKTVAYWVMRHLGGEFVANDEVDDVRWLKPGKARKQLSYDLDRAVLADFSSTPVADSLIVLVRHAKAGKRTEWRGPDALRPLDVAGSRQALALAPFLAHFAPTRLIAADPTRCIQTLEPTANAQGLPIQIAPEFADEHYLTSSGATQTALFALAKPGEVSVVCSQGVTIPSLIDLIGPAVGSIDTHKADSWVLTVVDGDVIAADHYDAPAR